MMLKQYIRRNKRKHPIGILVADQVNVLVCVGWSLCNHCDVFDEVEGENIAKERMTIRTPVNLPHSVYKQYLRFKNHAERYYRFVENSGCKKE